MLSKKENLSIDSVVNFVNSNFTVPEDKARAYYRFTSLYIAYNVQRLDELLILTTNMESFDGPLHYTISQKPEDVFKNRKGVCEGICRLMVKFCESSGIQSQMVVGYCKTPEGDFVKDIGHAWNAVKLDSAWKLLDITWSSGYIDYNRQFVRHVSGKYFLMDPEEFAEGHLPLDPMWQLLQKPITKNYFIAPDTAKQKYFSEHYSYNDSINKYLKLAETDKKYFSLLHYYTFEPDNKNMARNVDVFVNNRAANRINTAGIYYDEFISFFNAKLKNNPTKTNCNKGLAMLQSTITELNDAKVALKNKTALTAEFASAFKDMNDNIRKNLEEVNRNLKLLKEIRNHAVK